MNIAHYSSQSVIVQSEISRYFREMNSSWCPLEQQIYKNLLQEKMLHKKWSLMVSGGLDSMALLEVMQRIAPALRSEIHLIHIHHGDIQNSKILASEFASVSAAKQLMDIQISHFRRAARNFVEGIAKEKGLACESVESPIFLKSEKECRDFRYQEAHRLRIEKRGDHLIFAHHENDFLETQFIRLIRGSGPETIFHPMQEYSELILRPFLRIRRDALLDYQKKRAFPFLEDPSNASLDPLRNWLRNDWLPQLESYRPGSLSSFSRSLSLLAEREVLPIPEELYLYQAESNSKGVRKLVGFRKNIYDQLPLSLRRDVIVRVLNSQKINNFSYNHILEVIKYLDKADKLHRFKVASLSWTVELGDESGDRTVDQTVIVRWDSSQT